METKDKEICIVGLGYVGLTLAVSLAYSGLKVFGVEVNEEILKSLKNRKAHFSEIGLNEIIEKVIEDGSFSFDSAINKNNSFDVFIITVGTPLDEKGTPRMDMIINATNEVAELMNEDSLIILRSTVQIGTTRNIVRPILQKTGYKFDLAMCPERTLEGNAIEELSKIPQIIGSDSIETSSRCSKLFNSITNQVNIVSSWETAEIIKLSDNTFRDVSFAFGNEISRVCNAFGVDCYEVIENGKANYPRTNIAKPGLVGGPCLEKDPHIYSYSAKKKGIDMPITLSSRKINENQPKEVCEVLLNSRVLRKVSNPKILLCGLAFKGQPETDDLRGSMGIRFLECIEGNYEIHLFDYVVDPSALSKFGIVFESFDEIPENTFNLIVILNNHINFKNLGLQNLSRNLDDNGIIFDFWNNFESEPKKIKEEKKYFHLGNLGGIL